MGRRIFDAVVLGLLLLVGLLVFALLATGLVVMIIQVAQSA